MTARVTAAASNFHLVGDGFGGTELLLDTTAVAVMLGVTPATVRRYRQPDRREHFPTPDLVLGRTPAWRADTIRAWQATRPGRTGRPRRPA